MWTDSKISLAMGLQSTLATKRKHEFAANNKKTDFYTNCSPSKTTKWSIDRNLLTNNSQVVSHNSITKIDIVATSVSENWNQEPVDCISKLQAVTVPSDTWGSISTRSTLATTLLSTDDLDEDDDDFEDDYDEEESVIPTYCSVRYACPSQPPQRIYQTHPNGYITKPNFYTEPFPQQNCSRTINQQFRMGTLNWNNNNNNNNNSNINSKNNNNNSNNNNKNHSKNNNQNSNYYISSESLYSQQTIRCAENGKSYLELGSSNLNTNLTARHSKKCGCDGCGTWCNSKNCYKDIRLKIRNLSMFKLSKFRQVSEQSLYRSVLICNTLKQIDKEIEIESKDAQQQHVSTVNSTNNNEYSSIRCTRVCNLTRGNNNNNVGVVQQRNNNLSTNNNDESNNRECFQSFLQLNSSKSNPEIIFNSNQQCTNDLLHPYDHYPFREQQSGRATPFPAVTTIPLNETDSGFGDDDNNRTINWSSVLSLSSQSALDPLNNNDLFSILPSTTIASISCTSQAVTSTALSFTTSSTTSSTSTCSSILTSQLATTNSTSENTCTSWEYGFLDMDLGLGTEFTELAPGCKISSEELFKTITPTLSSTRYVHENEMESPAHIMVGS